MAMRIKSFGVPRGNTRDAIVFGMSDGSTIRMSKTERDAEGTDEKIQTRLRAALGRDDFHTALDPSPEGKRFYRLGKHTQWPWERDAGRDG